MTGRAAGDISITVASHPLLEVAAFVTEFPVPLSELTTPPVVLALLDAAAPAPVERDEEVRARVRDLLRHGGYKPTGRGKPASEYLVRAAGENPLGPINLAVDVLNAVSLHSGLPISVVDLERVRPPFHIECTPPDTEYVFNASGQSLRLDGLLCLVDGEGPCATPVKDAHRTKTAPETRRTVSVVWGSRKLEGRTAATTRWYRTLLDEHGARTRVVLP